MTYLYNNKGIYRTNGKPFSNKLEAVLEANTVPNSWVEWDYHDAEFGSHDWSIEPKIALDELYKTRALQLREAYDHLALFYSGGIDSWTILNTFVTNNIKLDEIYIWGAFEAEEKEYHNLSMSRDPGYYTREVLQTMPLVKKLAVEKGIKISVYDWTRDMLDATQDLDWIWRAGLRFDPAAMVRNRFHKVFRQHNEMVHKGKKVGFVFGIDKPRLMRDDDNIYFAFLDVIMTNGTVPTNDILGEYWENDEYFYWSPNLPELSIKQSHVVVNWLRANNKLNLIRHMHNSAAFHDESYYSEVNRAVYSEWNHNIWQVKKPTGATYSELSKWFLDSNFEAKLRWESCLWEVERQCGQKWFNNNTINDGLKGHISPLYKIASYKSNTQVLT